MKSIRFFLVIVILSTITLLAFLTALNGYRDSMAKAEELFDSELVDKAHLLSIAFSSNSIKDLALNPILKNELKYDNHVSQPLIEKKKAQISRQDSPVKLKNNPVETFFAFQIWRNETLLLHSPQAPQEPIANFQQGFQNRNFLDYRWRIYSYFNEKSNLWIMTAERMDIRYVLAENIVLETILPILLMLPLMGILIWTIISYGLSPLRVLAKELGNKRADDLTPLAIDKQPVELIQVVNSTNDLFNRLKAAFLREKRFASDAAHELRTPISAIKIHLHNLSHLIPEDESSFKQLKLSVDRMGHLVEQILNLNRTSTEQYSARFNSFDLYDLVQEIIINEYEHFAEKNLKVSLEGEHCQLEGDKFSLEILVQNLLSNAYKYTPEGGSVLLNVGLDKTADTSNIILQVEDSGPGVPEDQYERLFDRFYRLDGDCHASGTIGCGLGLAIVQQIVELHHAKIILGKSGFPSGLLVQIVFSKRDPQ